MTPLWERVALVTLGCPKNEVDSGVLAGLLEKENLTLAANPQEADVIVINTCGFIEDAKRESIEAILEAAELKKSGQVKQLVVWGCLSQRYRNEIPKEIPEVDAWFGVEPFQDLLRYLTKRSLTLPENPHAGRLLSTLPHSAYIKIAEGCNHGCRFCAIPGIKGRYRSRSIDSIEEEARALLKRGVRELLLVAQDTTFYGRDRQDGASLPALLERLAVLDGARWIRIMYGHPAHLTGDLVDVMVRHPNICRYIDLPLQHISDAVLTAMGRKTRRAHIEAQIRMLRVRLPDVTLRTTFIVGFPGETEDDFQALLDFVRETRFERLGVFPYSDEEGTPAFTMTPKVPRAVIQKRLDRLMEEQMFISEALNRAWEGRTMAVMVDGYDDEQGLFYGRSQGDAVEIDQTVWVSGPNLTPEEGVESDLLSTIGRVVNVKITGSSEYDLMGEMIPNPQEAIK